MVSKHIFVSFLLLLFLNLVELQLLRGGGELFRSIEQIRFHVRKSLRYRLSH